VAVVEHLADLLENLGGSLFVEILDLNDTVVELTTFADLSNEIDISLILEVLVELNDVRMIKSLQNLDLSFEA